MDHTLEHPDDGLRERIRKGFEASAKRRSKKIEERPKTPRNSNKGKRNVSISKKLTEINDEKKTSKKKTKTEKVEKKPVVRKTKPKSEVADAMKKLTLKQTKPTKPEKAPAKKQDKKRAGLYLCPKCDKTYKS